MIYDIRLQHFRSYDDESFEFNPAVTIIVGPNASGKTNLLEAILVTALGNSYRAKDSDLVAFESDWARLDAQTISGDRTIKLTPHSQTKKLYEFDGKEYRRLTVQHTIPTVLFEPNHLRLLAGSPDRRRQYLDELLSQLSPGYATNLRRYKQALAQRNALLKSHGTGDINQMLFPWNIKLTQLAGMIAEARQRLVDELSPKLTELYALLSNTKKIVTATYGSSCQQGSYESSMLRKLEQDVQLDGERGFTGVGPHRDDLLICFDDRPSGLVASRGETRTVVLALKILELQQLERVRDQRPILLLDDVFSELDGARRHALTDYLSRYQTFITTTDADIALASFGQDCTVIPLGG